MTKLIEDEGPRTNFIVGVFWILFVIVFALMIIYSVYLAVNILRIWLGYPPIMLVSRVIFK
jgi:hypothetical protein